MDKTALDLFPYRVEFQLRTFVVKDLSERWQAGQPLRSSEDVFRYAQGVYQTLDADKEHFTLFALNQKNRFIDYKVMSTGSLTASLVHPREIYRAALAFDAAAIIFTHNHPSGDPQPSQDDIAITQRLKECGELFGIRVLDHVVLGRERFFSFSDKGML